jgi:hypothetical protein
MSELLDELEEFPWELEANPFHAPSFEVAAASSEQASVLNVMTAPGRCAPCPTRPAPRSY